MKITNRENLPSGFYNACLGRYERVEGTYSVTELQKGSTEIVLSRRHYDDIEEDCSDMVWSVFGSAVHSIMEKHTVGETQVSEMGFTGKAGDAKVSGHIDLFDAEKLVVCDYKTCSVWKIVFGDYKDWRNQLLAYCWLLDQNGFKARRGVIVAIMKDHSKREARYKPDYPQSPVKRMVFDFTDQDLEDYEQGIEAKVAEIESLSIVEDKDLPPCLPEERWAKPTTFAVMKKGRKTAMRVLNSMTEAENWMENNSGDSIAVREGEDVKCEGYCSVNTWCPYWQAKLEAKGGEE